MRRSLAYFLLIFFFGNDTLAFNDSIPAIFVGNNKGGTVSIIDATSLEVVKTIDIIPDKKQQSKIKQRFINRYVNKKLGPKYVDDLDILPDGQTMVISRPMYADIAAFDLNSEKLLWTIPLKQRPDHQVLTKDGRYLFVSMLTNKKGLKIDLQQRKVVGKYKTGRRPHSIVLNASETKVYNGSLEGDNIVVVNTETLKKEKELSFPNGIRPFKITPDEQKIYAQLFFFHGLIEYDVTLGKEIRRVELPIPDFVKSIPLDSYPFDAAHHGIGISKDNDFISLAGTVSNYVAILSFPDLKLIKTLDAGIEPSWITNGFDGDLFFVSARKSDKVFVYSYKKQELVKEIQVGDYPQRMTKAIWVNE